MPSLRARVDPTRARRGGGARLFEWLLTPTGWEPRDEVDLRVGETELRICLAEGIIRQSRKSARGLAGLWDFTPWLQVKDKAGRPCNAALSSMAFQRLPGLLCQMAPWISATSHFAITPGFHRISCTDRAGNRPSIKMTASSSKPGGAI